MARKEYLGGVEATTLASGITSVDTAISVADGSTFPTGSSYPFVIVIGRGTAAEEKILCSSRTGNAITASTRGYDGTTGVAHSSGAVVEHCIDAIVVNKASELISAATTQGDILYWSAAETPVRLAKGTARQALLMNSGATAPEWGASLASLLTAQGDIVYASSANTPARLAKGSASQSLRMNSGATAPEWTGARGSSMVSTSEGTASSAFGNLSTVQSVTVVTGTTARVSFSCDASNAASAADAEMGIAVSGATTAAAPAGISRTRWASRGSNLNSPMSNSVVLTGLTAGSNTFTLQFTSPDNSTTINYQRRSLIVEDYGS